MRYADEASPSIQNMFAEDYQPRYISVLGWSERVTGMTRKGGACAAGNPSAARKRIASQEAQRTQEGSAARDLEMPRGLSA
jgi:hypothetical protein